MACPKMTKFFVFFRKLKEYLSGYPDSKSGGSIFPHPTPLPGGEGTGTCADRKHLLYALAPRGISINCLDAEKRQSIRVIKRLHTDIPAKGAVDLTRKGDSPVSLGDSLAWYSPHFASFLFWLFEGIVFKRRALGIKSTGPFAGMTGRGVLKSLSQGLSIFGNLPGGEGTGTCADRKHLLYSFSPRERSGVRGFRYSVSRPIHLVSLLALCFLGAIFPAWGADFEEAYELSRRLDTAQSAWHDALKSGDPSTIERQEARLLETAMVTRNAYEAAGANASDDPEILHRYAAALRALGHHDLAAGVLTRAVRLAPGEAVLWMHLGADLAESGPGVREEAFQALHKSLQLDAQSSAAAQTHYLLGDLFHREGLFDFAREHQESALRLDPEHVPARIALAALRIRGGEVLEGSRELDALGRRAQPYDAETRVLLREALAGFDAARRVFPDTPEHHAAYARALYRAARFPDAILAARRATTLNPDDFDTWNFIAAVQGQLGNLAQARDAYGKSLEANPEQPQVRAILEEMKED